MSRDGINIGENPPSSLVVDEDQWMYYKRNALRRPVCALITAAGINELSNFVTPDGCNMQAPAEVGIIHLRFAKGTGSSENYGSVMPRQSSLPPFSLSV